MFGVIFIMIGLGAVVFGAVRKSSRDIDFKNSQINNKFPFWLDSEGVTRWKSNNQKIMATTWNNEGHMIITDKKFRDINWTWEQIKQQLEENPDQIIQFGRDIHSHDKIPGIRYVTKVDGRYEYYVVIRQGLMDYYFDIHDQRVVRPVPEAIEFNQDAKRRGYEYWSNEEIRMGALEINRMDWLERRRHIMILGKPEAKFNPTTTLRHTVEEAERIKQKQKEKQQEKEEIERRKREKQEEAKRTQEKYDEWFKQAAHLK